MIALYDTNEKKKSKELNINISNYLEKNLIELIKEQEIKNWEAKNRTSINSYNEKVAKNGTFSDNMRNF